MKIVIGVILFLGVVGKSFSCDYCNCYLGLNPHFKKNTIGIRYHFMNYTGTHESESELQKLNLSKDDFWETRSRVELHSQWYPTQKIKIIFSAPYVINCEGINTNAEDHSHNNAVEDSHHETETINGIGDPMAIAHFQIFNSAGDSLHFNQRLLAGGGIKFPLGKWKLEDGAEAHERIHQSGTGSWDLIMSAEYLVQYRRTGFNLNVSYLMATTNNQSYRFANRLNANLVCYYVVKINQTSLYPSVGTFFENAGRDTDNNFSIDNSGGTILFAHAGFDFYFKNFSITTAIQLPAMQQLNEPQPKMKYRCIAGFGYSFN
jgi:hypothetical protein